MQDDYIARITHYLNSLAHLKPVPTKAKVKIASNPCIKAIIFDIYGTLIISASGDLDQSNASIENLDIAIKEGGFIWFNDSQQETFANKLLEHFHATVIEHQNKLKKSGHPYPEVDIIEVWNECLDFGIVKQWIIEKTQRNTKLLTVVFELLSNQVYPMPNMHKCLDKLFNSNLPLGIVSNAQFYTPIIMNKFIHNEVTEHEYVKGFDEDISFYSYKLKRSKPDVKLFENLAHTLKNKYNLLPEQTVFVGNDMLKDVWTAKQMGFKTILFAADKRSLKTRIEDKRCTNLQADYVIDDLMQIFDIVSI